MNLSPDRPRWRRWELLLTLWPGVWTLVALFDIAQTYLLLNATAHMGTDIPLRVVVGRGLAEWYLWAILAPVLFVVARRLPLDGSHWARNLALQALASAVLSLFKLGCDLPFVLLFPWPERPETCPDFGKTHAPQGVTSDGMATPDRRNGPERRRRVRPGRSGPQTQWRSVSLVM